MRNPLSAMLLCADGIAQALLDFQAVKDKNAILSDALVENNLDAAQTIVLCAQHQKRIIDDVLTLSKLNSTMLHVTPVQVQVETTLRRTLKMFENEFVAHDIRISFEVEPSYREANIDLVFCDPVRLTQIFINLLTNVPFPRISVNFVGLQRPGYQVYSIRKQKGDFRYPWCICVRPTQEYPS